MGYVQRQQEINKIALYWLKAQPQVRGIEETTPPLLESSRTALCGVLTKPIRQGATHLLAELAPDLSNQVLSVLVLRNFIPSLLQLADLLDLDLPYPGAVRQHLPQPPASAASLKSRSMHTLFYDSLIHTVPRNGYMINGLNGTRNSHNY